MKAKSTTNRAASVAGEEKISTSQRSFGEILDKGRRLLAYVESLPDFAPTDGALTAAGLRTFLQELAALNAELESARAELRQARELRQRLYHGSDGLLERAMRLRDYAASLPGGRGGMAHTALRRLLRTMRPWPAAKTPAPPTADDSQQEAVGATPRHRSRSELSFGALLARGRELEQVVRAMGEQAPQQGDLSAEALAALLGQIAEANRRVESAALRAARLSAKRTSAFLDSQTGLAGVVSRVKSAIAAQYGRGSSEFANLRAMRV